jgi:hypothetical protein
VPTGYSCSSGGASEHSEWTVRHICTRNVNPASARVHTNSKGTGPGSIFPLFLRVSVASNVRSTSDGLLSPAAASLAIPTAKRRRETATARGSLPRRLVRPLSRVAIRVEICKIVSGYELRRVGAMTRMTRHGNPLGPLTRLSAYVLILVCRTSIKVALSGVIHYAFGMIAFRLRVSKSKTERYQPQTGTCCRRIMIM